MVIKCLCFDGVKNSENCTFRFRKLYVSFLRLYQEFLLFYELSNQIYEILSIFLFLVFADTTNFSKLFDGGGT